MTVGFIAATVPAAVVNVSGTTLFQIAMVQTDDPLQWVAIAELNGLIDPWITAEQSILIPPVFPSGPQDGILESAVPAQPFIAPPPQPTTAPAQQFTAPPPPTNLPTQSPMLDFSQPGNSQFVPLL